MNALLIPQIFVTFFAQVFNSLLTLNFLNIKKLVSFQNTTFFNFVFNFCLLCSKDYVSLRLMQIIGQLEQL